jgi:hypothetical protein
VKGKDEIGIEVLFGEAACAINALIIRPSAAVRSVFLKTEIVVFMALNGWSYKFAECADLHLLTNNDVLSQQTLRCFFEFS